jgi:hypothetical protein
VRVNGGMTLWKQYRLYRRVPADGKIFLTVALTGLGTAYFDDLQIEPLVPDPSAPADAPLDRIAAAGRPDRGATALPAPRTAPVNAVPVSQPRSSPYVPPRSYVPTMPYTTPQR